MFYRKKPVVIEAFQLGVDCYPDWFVDRVVTGKVDQQNMTADIYTLEGVMHAECGDFIIKGVAGELYPCKPDIFMQTYEPMDEKKRVS